jgi:hypothetical protein
VFKKQDIEKFIKDGITLNLPENNKLLENSLQINYSSASADMKSGKATVNVQSSAKTYYDIKTSDLVDLFATKSGDQIKQVVDQVYSGKVTQLKVNFWPFWVHKAPSDRSKIKVNLLFDN